MADNESENRPQGGTKLDDRFPDGVGKPGGGDDPVVANPQPVKVPGNLTKPRK